MTNWEKICSNKEDFIAMCVANPYNDYFVELATNAWCKSKCPARGADGKCTYPDDCVNTYPDKEILRMWLDEECEED